MSRYVRYLAFVAALSAAACSQILSIEDAYVDPALSGGSGGTAVLGSAGSAGSATMSHGNHDSGGEPPVATAGSGGNAGEQSVATGGSSAGSQSSGGSVANGAGGGAPDDEPDLCERYCDQVTRVCKGKYEQYRTVDQCMRVCKRLTPGMEGDKDTNTASCRLRQAQLAEAEPFVYCKSAGPLGEGKCGSDCASYCGLMEQVCTAASTAGNLELSYFQSAQACLSACAALPANPEGPTAYSSSEAAEPSSYVGNNVFCRTYHVAAAIEQDTPDEHCPHAMGGDPCID
jgi:hypothetical protein